MSRAPVRVLVASADDGLRAQTADVLRRSGWEALLASDSHGALATMQEKRPDLAIFDAALDLPDGDPICARARRIDQARKTPIVMMVPDDGSGATLAALEAGADEVMTWPPDPVVLVNRVGRLLELGSARETIGRVGQQLDDLQRIARIATWERDIEGGDLFGAASLREILGFEARPGPIATADIQERLHPDDRAALLNAFEKSADGGDGFVVDTRIAFDDDSRRVLHWRAEVVSDPTGRPTRVTGTIQDITERRQAEQQLRYLTHHDGLTGLANRSTFMHRLGEALGDARRSGDLIALMVVDVDNFKRVNEILGHTAGDRLLQNVAERLDRCLRQADRISRLPVCRAGDISRLGADEFTIVLTELSLVDDVARVARRLIDVLREPFVIDGADLIVSASIGVAMHPTDGDDVDTLMRSAHAAMYKAKEEGRNNFRFFTDSIQDPGSRRFALERKLCRAFENHELRVFYQPQVHSETGRITGVEALLRWEDPDYGAVSPAEFVPLAEEAGLITPIGEWVLRTACRQAKAWRESGLPPVRMAVNISPHHFETDTFMHTVTQTLWDTGMEPELLELEITENALMRNQDTVVAILSELKRIGVSVSLDDFGTGYSSLSYLKRFPVDAVKIDRSFIRDIGVDADDAALTAAIISMAKALRLRVVAEGVETEGQRDYLADRKCDELQGYLYSPPVEADVVAEYLAVEAADPEEGSENEA